jgi:protein-tyrosine phosphatase
MNTDFHSHILPGMDDGSRSVEESLGMLRMEAQHGIRQIVATPHFYPQQNSPEEFLERRAESARLLFEAMAQEAPLPEVHLGAEVYFFPGISDCEQLRELTIDQNGYILIEMPLPPWTDRMYRELQDIHYKQGLNPIVAHVDRYIRPFKTYDIPNRLAQMPVLVQANATFFRDRFTRSMAMRMLRSGQIHLLGSDCHNLTSRAPNLDQAIQLIGKQLGADALQWIQSNADEVLQGEYVINAFPENARI